MRLNRTELLQTLNNPQEKEFLRLQLVLNYEVGKPLVTATYKLEGDGLLAMLAYDTINGIGISFATEAYPQTRQLAFAIAQRFGFSGEELYANALNWVRRARMYFEQQFLAPGTPRKTHLLQNWRT